MTPRQSQPMAIAGILDRGRVVVSAADSGPDAACSRHCSQSSSTQAAPPSHQPPMTVTLGWRRLASLILNS
jgi:hypothetical protein